MLRLVLGQFTVLAVFIGVFAFILFWGYAYIGIEIRELSWFLKLPMIVAAGLPALAMMLLATVLLTTSSFQWPDLKKTAQATWQHFVSLEWFDIAIRAAIIFAYMLLMFTGLSYAGINIDTMPEYWGAAWAAATAAAAYYGMQVTVWACK